MSDSIEETDILNWTIFNELRTMDEDEPGFSKELIHTFTDQAEGIFLDMNTQLDKDEPNLKKLSELGHYLKGSAASLGLVKIQEQCERIQNYGLQKDFDGLLNDRKWEEGIREALLKARDEFEKAIEFFDRYYEKEAAQ
ncbi:Multistep phosphorelay regulator 1 [Wickerhamomyces ciferrii]|uniref:Multistep phosphorelay regulator 1 n=1 Tax=Wickerhamomyces ciferrii (strain ATCC 14091 / BCRC 22168 / CBS 111 / JCM 3599 / NBRC 0793 / NRRL Y-1031 F-60-10) TaxID=1206466 RepID=K0KI47_WICCF|nr:Multistep phosphorelay regulator 1 [Wickerhamomyces ciferrii]CCH41832.1 Multistep phosphorelay regulator 1 [Wickerhamomyces ciferrii]